MEIAPGGQAEYCDYMIWDNAEYSPATVSALTE